MGMYTELVLSTRVKDDPTAVAVLKYLTGQVDDPPPDLPDHPFFRAHRWPLLLRLSSYYFVPRSTSLFEFDEIGKYWVLISRSDLKNYDDEIGKFVDWIGPYLDDKDEMIGYRRYEEDREPTILYGPAS